MKMNISVSVRALLFAATALALTGAGAARAEDPVDAAPKARLDAFEKGPATIDISKYPEALKDNYELFSQKCTKCHKLSRPINSDYVLPDEWSRYVKRMMHKPGSGISSSDGKKIYEFLVYDSSVRKKTKLDEKLAKASAEDKATAEAAIKKVRDQYDAK